MIEKGNRVGGHPILIQNKKSSHLERVPLDGKAFSESWIQELIHDNPAILPIGEIDTAFSSAISIGREVFTPVGYIDNLFVSPDGYITIIETKLWRNPEARREVVGQIIDYAKELNKWTFTDLDNAVKAYNQLFNKNSDGVLATVKRHIKLGAEMESMFIDNISRNLKRGRFLLLIVGDGIRESVEEMVEYLSHSPQLYFTLGLVELQVYQLQEKDKPLLVIPQLVTRTKEITRAIVKIEGTQPGNVSVNIETDLGKEDIRNKSLGYKRMTITSQDFFEQLEKNSDKSIAQTAYELIKDGEEMGLITEWNSGSFSMKLPDPAGSGIKISILNVTKEGLINLGFSKDQFEKLKLPFEISHSFAFDTASLIPGLRPRENKKHIWSKHSTLLEFQKVRIPFMEKVRKYVEQIKLHSLLDFSKST